MTTKPPKEPVETKRRLKILFTDYHGDLYLSRKKYRDKIYIYIYYKTNPICRLVITE